MGDIRMTASLREALDRLVDLFRTDQPVEFIATEFLVSSDIQQLVNRRGKFGRALQAAETSINRDGFQWWQPPIELRQIIEVMRSEVQRSEEDDAARAAIESLLLEADPKMIARVRVD